MYRLFGVLLCSVVLSAQPVDWETRLTLPAVSANDLCFLRDGQYGWLVGSDGAGGEVRSAIFRTTDGGATWSEVAFPNPTSVSLGGVFFVSADSGWVVGDGGYIIRTTDGGVTWQRQTSPSGRKLGRVHFVSPTLGWITGGWNDGASWLLLKTTNGGASWQDISFGADCYSAEDIWFADSLRGWIVGQNSRIDPVIYHTTDGGATWAEQGHNLPAGAGPVSSICFPTPRKGWASTSSIYRTPAGSILHTTDGGANWTIQGQTGLHYNYALDAPDTLRVAVLATQVLSPATARVVVTTDGGVTWTPYNLPTYDYGSGCQYRGSRVWVAQGRSQVLCSENNGANPRWQLYAPLWGSVAWSEPGTGWVVTGSSAGGGYALKTTDGGLNWSPSTAPGGVQVQFIDSQRGWMLQEGNSARIHRTTNGGQNWTSHSIGTTAWVGYFHFATPDSGWACGSNGTMRATTDGGVTWTAQNLGVTQYCEVVHFASSTEGWAAGGYGGGNGFIRHTTDGGQTWTAQTPALPAQGSAICFLDNRRGWLGAYGGSVQRTTDGGATWQAISTLPHFYFEDILFEDTLVGWAAVGNPAGSQPGEDGRGYIYRTTDGGATWQQEYVSPSPRGWILSLARQPGGPLWACGGHATILSSASPGGFAARPLPAPGTGLRVTPNPARARAAVSLPPGARAVAVYDAAGRAILTRPLDGGAAGTLVLDLRGLASGVYLVRADTERGPAEVKLIVR